jgi:hypothetical protein
MCYFLIRLDCVSGDKKENLEFFNTDRLAEGTRNKAWERIRITCSQPFRSALSVRSKLQTANAACRVADPDPYPDPHGC